MRVYITGASGLVGRNVLEKAPNNVELLTPTSKDLNLLNYRDIISFLKEHKPDLIIHTAGKVGGIKANKEDMFGFLVDNSIIGLNLIRAAKEAGIKNLINLSTCCAYPVESNNPLKEEYLFTGALDKDCEGYALAKNSALKACDFASKQYSVNYKTIIPVNLYGKYDKFDIEKSHFMPAVIKKIYNAIKNNEESVEIWGTGKNRREIFYAGDLADFIWYCANNIHSMPQIVNCSWGKDYSINEIYQITTNILGYKGKFHHNLDKPEGITAKLTCNQKMVNFGWEPKISLEKGIKETVLFYKENIDSE
ncbi:MAG: NAD-dependent epimerase/dehydratase family protein [Alphaproteobacteria bacterium]|nr:NAD-dependent epimerase/dehydratase family protein [Alphaproteobacteria bacterium]